MDDHNNFADFIWHIADTLRGTFNGAEYEEVLIPMTVLRRFDCVLAETKAQVLVTFSSQQGSHPSGEALDNLLNRVAGQNFHNHSPFNFLKLKADPDHIARHLVSYIQGFSANVRRLFEYFEFEREIERMDEADVLFLVVSRFGDLDLRPETVSKEQMGLIFEELIRRCNELAKMRGFTTPRDLTRLMVNLLFATEAESLASPGAVRTLLDPVCGSGSMLTEALSHVREHYPRTGLSVYGQDSYKRAIATAASVMLLTQSEQNSTGDNIRLGDIFTNDRFDEEPTRTFDYLLANPPFGVNWKRRSADVKREQEKSGFAGRFGAGLPRTSDASLLFLQHMISKFEPVMPLESKHGTRMVIVFAGSPLFTGGAGSGESRIRRWIIENDWLEAVIALPEKLFYSTDIGTYVCVITNRKEKRRRGKLQLIDARKCFVPGRRGLGNKRRKLGEGQGGEPNQIAEIVGLYDNFAQNARSKIFKNSDFGYHRITVERPLRLRYRMTGEDMARFLDACPHLLDDVQAIDKSLGREPHPDWNKTWRRIEDLLRKRRSKWTANEKKQFRKVFTQTDSTATPVRVAGRKMAFEPDPKLRDLENIPLSEDIADYFEREVRPHLPDAWIDRDKDKVGYEINFDRHFYAYTPPRPLEEIDAELKEAEAEILRLLRKENK